MSRHSIKTDMPPVPAVSGVVFDACGRILLIKRGKPPRMGEWNLPGGSVEPGESGEMGLRREILEECGIEVEGVSFLAEKSLLDRDGYGNVRYHYRIKVFTCFSSRKDVHAQSDAACAEWFDPDQLDSLGLAPDMRKIIDKARRISR